MDRTLLHTFLRRASEHGDRAAVRELRAGGAPADRELTWQEWAAQARRLAGAMREQGVRPGERVAILAGNSFVWPVAEMAAIMTGAITVGIYPTSAPVQVHAVLNDCAAKLIVVDTADQYAKVAAVRSGLPMLRDVVAAQRIEGVSSLEHWTDHAPLEVLHDPAADDVAIIIYTSGSTGEPKGACISHRYLQASAESIRSVLALGDTDSSLSFLPFCHAAERIFGLYTRVHAGMTCGLVADHRNIWSAARAFEPTLFGGLPRFYEKLYEELSAEFGAALPDRGAAVRQRLADFVGGRVRVATSGGAALPARVARYLDACGLRVVGAYGLTEHLCAAMHEPAGEMPPASVGQAMPGTEFRIAADGEIMIRKSALTFSGYFNNPDATRAAFTADGSWLRTGDLGRVDEQGFLYVTGREKDLIALSTGKKVAPLPIEARLVSAPLISQAVLIGENQKYISALIALRPAWLDAWLRERGLRLERDAACQHPAVIAAVQTEIDRVNADLSRTEQIKRFALLPQELSVERDELTPTMKLRRNVIGERYRKHVESLYGPVA